MSNLKIDVQGYHLDITVNQKSIAITDVIEILKNQDFIRPKTLPIEFIKCWNKQGKVYANDQFVSNKDDLIKIRYIQTHDDVKVPQNAQSPSRKSMKNTNQLHESHKSSHSLRSDTSDTTLKNSQQQKQRLMRELNKQRQTRQRVFKLFLLCKTTLTKNKIPVVWQGKTYNQIDVLHKQILQSETDEPSTNRFQREIRDSKSCLQQDFYDLKRTPTQPQFKKFSSQVRPINGINRLQNAKRQQIIMQTTQNYQDKQQDEYKPPIQQQKSPQKFKSDILDAYKNSQNKLTVVSKGQSNDNNHPPNKLNVIHKGQTSDQNSYKHSNYKDNLSSGTNGFKSDLEKEKYLNVIHKQSNIRNSIPTEPTKSVSMAYLNRPSYSSNSQYLRKK